jgi:2-polyprenyl-3-methyl-5-hydroxy-6-metoxy-1,4-benzoquinol methylase
MNPDSFKPNGTNCPFCLGKKLKKIAVKANDSEPKGLEIQIVECIDCCFAWQWPIHRNRNESERYFEEEYSRKKEDSYFDLDKRIEVSRLQVEFLNKLLPNGSKSLLDIGAGDGTFIKTAAEQGWHATGIEPAKVEFDFDDDDSHGSAIMIQGQIGTLKKDKKFNVITMWDVIEHVNEPIDLIKEAIKYIESDGMLVIETGNYQSADRIVGKKEWWCYQLDHRWYFSPNILTNILIQLGFKQVIVSSKTLRPWWNLNADYISPSLFKLAKSSIKKPHKAVPQFRDYRSLKKAWKEWPQWVANGIFTLSAKRNK